MANLDAHFKVNYQDALSNEKAIFRGEKYRITILSERLIRFEYSEKGVFFDHPTELARFRNFNVPNFQVEETDKNLIIQTKYFVLEYVKEKSFIGPKYAPDQFLKVGLMNSDKVWYFNHAEARNFGGTKVSLDKNIKSSLEKGLYSTDGFASIDDSKNLVYMEDGFLVKPTERRIDTYLFIYRRDFGSVLLLNEFWHLKDKRNLSLHKTGFTFSKELFSNPLEFTNYMHDRGVRIGLNIDPIEGIGEHEEKFRIIATELGLINTKKIPFNAFDKTFIAIYFNHLIKPLDSLGVDFYWIDYKYDLDSLKALNHYHFLNYYRDNRYRPLVFSRNSITASHLNGIHFSGNTEVSWNTLDYLPSFNSSGSNIGLSWWSHDIGGFKGGMEDSELYIRYVQLGTYSPIFRFACERGHYYKREPWRWDVKTYRIVKDYLTLRHRLIPYLYTESYRYHKEGIPLVRPLYYQYPDIFDNENNRNEYYFGSELLVAPIIRKKDIVMNRVVHRMFMPEGIWYDIVTGKKFPGNRNYVAFFKDEDYPVFARAGAIIPFGENDNMNDTTPPKNMEIQIFPGVNNTYKMYEDDGLSDLYKKGYYLLTDIDYNYLPNNYTVIIRAVEGKSGIVPEYRNYKIRFRNTKPTNQVEVYFKDQKVVHKKYQGSYIEIEAVHVINEDIESIISDLPIATEMKEKIDSIVFGNDTIKKKRIAIRKLNKKGLEQKFIKLFLKLLEYIEQV